MLHWGIFSLHHLLAFSTWRSEPPSILGYDVQSRLSQLDNHSYQLVWHSKPLFPLGIHSYCFSLAFRATISSQFGVQSHGFSSAFRAVFSIWRSEPHFNLAFRAAFSIWR